ncbi:hypothetical protein NITUZ_30338 [Candidatus Nitrosotenuis uzonensis]|uniref:Uncharacterized protein n=1 Tax=Candidatus Nitrosotenuis uzonensis TaxID=1407055 RepID=V6ASH4_9ARCH|nr:hypothetical protein NITUZ_30338 [Candidatus Nitrosotenuis uzonensis]
MLNDQMQIIKLILNAEHLQIIIAIREIQIVLPMLVL